MKSENRIRYPAHSDRCWVFSNTAHSFLHDHNKPQICSCTDIRLRLRCAMMLCIISLPFQSSSKTSQYELPSTHAVLPELQFLQLFDTAHSFLGDNNKPQIRSCTGIRLRFRCATTLCRMQYVPNLMTWKVTNRLEFVLHPRTCNTEMSP